MRITLQVSSREETFLLFENRRLPLHFGMLKERYEMNTAIELTDEQLEAVVGGCGGLYDGGYGDPCCRGYGDPCYGGYGYGGEWGRRRGRFFHERRERDFILSHDSEESDAGIL